VIRDADLLQTWVQERERVIPANDRLRLPNAGRKRFHGAKA
jgi:hypothetical protein